MFLFQGVKKPFNEIIRANIGDCHAMGQVPITFIRQVLGLVVYNPLFKDSSLPDDVKERAHTILSGCKGGSVGSYTDSPGIEVIRRHVAQYIERRDGGIPCDWMNVVLSAGMINSIAMKCILRLLFSGASDAIKNVLKLLICESHGKKPGVMIPIPQYPLYSATLAEFGMEQIGYYLDESRNWSLEISELEVTTDCFVFSLV